MAINRCSLCDRTESTHRISRAGVCTTCDVAMIYWRKRSTTKLITRAHQLDSFQNRMELLLGNVKRIKRQKQKRKLRKAA